ncbi:glycosyltransferase [Calothrix sp. NIES-2098]|uniref:glycosyltransferase n=1 Tax=Calothrix sp. NIES-2098 TaxID=1954171 RepID=UPI000B604442|nr:family 2 glycosyl transferase [Calothrix sp. NIES-2098]
MSAIISVVICTHNPRIDYLDRVLKSLKFQTLPVEYWELLMIDNASKKILSKEIDLSWHPQSRHIREEQLGLTPARLRGIKEAIAETLVFVDDDNVLDSDYLEVALQISNNYPFIGAWGGQSLPEFEQTPPEWTKPYWWMLAIRELNRDQWSNLLLCYETAPVGAGMCVRKVVAQKYAELALNNLKRANLDPKGKQLLRAGDNDLAFTSCDVGLGTGVFVSLKLTHLIPANRLQEEYLLRLAEGIGYSKTIMESLRGTTPTVPKLSLMRKILEYYRLSRMDSTSKRFYQAFSKGKVLAIQELKFC